MTDFRALCAELVDDLELCDWPYKLKETIRADIDRARDALADGPAVPDGREPAAITGQPSDEELLETLDKATATFPPRHPEAEGLNAVEYPLALELRKARAVLARWGKPAPQPVPVSERPWEREGWCDKRGMCWWLHVGEDGVGDWLQRAPYPSVTSYAFFRMTHCLPAHALPIPHQQENAND